jgi:ubiquinone biosynthesis protein
MWSVARPVLERWVRDHLGPRGFLRDTRLALITLARLTPRLPALAERLVQMAEAPPPPPMATPRGWLWKWIALLLLMGNLAFYLQPW